MTASGALPYHEKQPLHQTAQRMMNRPCLQAVHLLQQLAQHALAHVQALISAAVTCRHHAVNFIKKDDGRAGRARSASQIIIHTLNSTAIVNWSVEKPIGHLPVQPRPLHLLGKQGRQSLLAFANILVV
jgi:hypothetical protein